MEQKSSFQYSKEQIGYNYNHEYQQLIRRIEELNLIEEDSICYVKNFKKRNEELILYVFNTDKIFKVKLCEEDEEKVSFEMYRKTEAKDFKFTINYDDEYTVSYLVNGKIEDFSINDTTSSYLVYYTKLIKLIINYFVN